jgi:hypothetical protein
MRGANRPVLNRFFSSECEPQAPAPPTNPQSQIRNPQSKRGIHGIPDPPPELAGDKPVEGKLVARPICGGLHYDYRPAA